MTEIAGEQRGRRSHARRNHELLVAAAREVFAEQGVDASLEEIARRAGVGIGTLYRHFATRDALVEAIFERRIGDSRRARRGRRRPSPTAGPRSWSSWSERSSCRPATACSRTSSCAIRWQTGRLASARQELRRHVERVLARAQAEGGLRADFTFADLALLLWSFAPVFDATAEVAPNAWRRHLHLLLDGLRAQAATPHAEPPLSDDQLQASMRSLRERAR